MTVSLKRVTGNLAEGRGTGRVLEGMMRDSGILHLEEYFQEWRWALGECGAYSRRASGNTG